MPDDPAQPPRRIYLDNAATSFPKPPEVYAAVNRYMTEVGANAGRATYSEALDAGGIIAQCRRKLARLFNARRPESIVFTHNCTDALNLAIHGIIDPARSNHLICTVMEHNSVLRPMHELVDRGLATLTIVQAESSSGAVSVDELARAIRPDTRLIAVGHGSNVTGVVQPIGEIAELSRAAGAMLLVDAAQTAGHYPIDVEAGAIDLLACAGHKGLLGPLGTGVLYVRPGLEERLRPQRQGGTGSVSQSLRQPTTMPDRYESGSANMPGIAGLLAAVEWIERKTVAEIRSHEQRLISRFLENVEPRIVVGGSMRHERIGVFSIVFDDFEPVELSALLENQFGILTRSGLHGAPLAHEALCTARRGGTTRISIGPFTTEAELDITIHALNEFVTLGLR